MERIPNPQLSRAAIDRLAELYSLNEKREGIHLSDLIYCLTKSWYNKSMSIPPTDEEVLLFALGYGLQKVLVPPEGDSIEKDGIWCSPDFTSIAGIKAELKTTRQSSMQRNKATKEKEPHDFSDTWEEQMMGYCYATGQTEYDLLILHMMGDYAPPFPQIPGWRVIFTQEEIDNNWEYMKRRKMILDQALEDDKPPEPFKYCKDWECQYCRYKMFCDSLVRKE